MKKTAARLGRQTPTRSFVLPYTATRGQEAIDLYNSTGRTAQEWQQLLLYDILAENDEGLWVHTKFGYSVPRRNGKNEIAAQLQLARADEMGCDFVEVTAHGGARPQHAVWQGKVYHRGGAVIYDGVRYEDFETATGYGTGAGLCGWNCRHNFYPFFPGLSEPNWGQGQLEALNAKEVEYGGQMYSRYEISQMQRALEREVRRAKRRYLAEDAAGLDASAAAVGLKNARQKLAAFVRDTGGRADSARTGVAGYAPDKYLAQYEAAGGDINAMRRTKYAKNKDKINAQKRAAYAAQAYRKDRGAASEIPLVRRGEKINISAKRVESYKTPVFVSDKAIIKPKALHKINQNTENALTEWGVGLDRKPQIVIVSDNELNGAVGIYDPCENIVYYAESVGQAAVQNASGGAGAIEAHEMWHMKQAEDFRQAGWTITRENRGEYLDALCKKCKERIDKLGVTCDNVWGISEYAGKMYWRGRYDEVEAEYKVLHRKKG